MKKIFFFLAAMALAITANAKVTTISPDAENDALRLAVHYAEDGDIIEMTEGTYVQCNNGYVAFDGKSVTVKAAEGANVVLQLQVPITLTNGGKATLQGIKIDASRLTELADWYEHVIYADDATEGKELVMDGCELYGFNMNKSAIYSKAENKLDLCRINNCYFHDVEKSCLFFEGTSIAELSVTNSTFANNIAKVTDSYYAGIIDVRNAAAKVTVDHCTFYNCLLMNTDYAAITMKGPQAANVVISNNIFMLPEAIDGHRAIRNDVEATNCMTFNYLKDNGGIHSSVTQTNCFLNVDPKFVDAAHGDFALAEGSPALGAATDGSNLGDPRWNKKTDVEPVDPVKPEPTYTENKLNTYAFGLESELNDTALVVTYRLNNSNATSVDVVVLKGDKVVATVPGTTTIGVNTVAVPTATLPQGFQLTWKVVVKGTSVEAPTQEEKMFSLYCPHGLAIDTDPESENFGRILVAEAMQGVPASGYVTSGKGAGLYVFNPSFTTDSVVYTGGNDFTRILASNGYQPWRVKISEDGRIFVSSLDLNGVVVWEVSKDLQTWTPVIAGTNDATDYNIYDADSNFVAGLNCSMDVIGKGEDLKLLLYSTNNKGIAFNQSGYRLDEYALGTATTWTGTPTNIINGGAYGVVHTNVEFIYDGEGGYWFGGSRAGNAGQPNLVHINAAGEQDYYTEDAGLYGGDGVLVHNGMLFKGKARTSSTVGNFGVWTIGKDADGKVTLTEKWSVVANGIGRNLNEFAVDYAENLYVVGNSGEKIIAYAMPYSGVVETPAAAKYAFHLGNLLEKTEMTGVVKRALTVGESTVVLTHEADGTANLYNVIDGEAYKVSQEGVVPVDPENKGSYLAISDIAVTEDGKLVAINYMQTQSGDDYVDAGYKRGETRVYLWNNLAGDPSILFTSKMSSNWFRSKQGLTMAVKGTSDNMEIFTTGIHATSAWARVSSYRVIDGVYTEPDVNNNDYYHFYDVADAVALETTVGTQYELNASPLGAMNWILDAELINPVEIVEPETNNVEISTCVALTQDLGKKYQGVSVVTVGEQHLMVAPYADAEGKLAGVKVLDITAGLGAATEVATADLDAAVEATAAATAVAVAENTLTITLVADATLYTLEVVLEEKPNYMTIEDNITNLVIDLDNMAITGGPSTMWQVKVKLGLAEDDNMDGKWSLSPESSVTVMGFDARIIDGYVYDIDVNVPAAKAVLYVEDSGFFYEYKLTMTNTPTEAIVVVVEDATVEIDTVPMFGDVVEYALKMTANWTDTTDNTTYPVLVEVPVYYPEATEPSEMTCTVTIGGEGDDDPWLGFAQGPLTITTVDGVVTAKGLIANPLTGVAFDVTVSGKLPETAVDNIQMGVKATKVIKNGQLIIINNDVEYSAQGQVIK